jgi:hypothetical protein
MDEGKVEEEDWSRESWRREEGGLGGKRQENYRKGASSHHLVQTKQT